MCGEAEKEHLLRRVATTLSSRQEVQQRQTYVIIKSEKQHLSPSAQNKRAPRTSLVKVKKLRIVRSPSTRLKLKESMHQDFELLKKKNTFRYMSLSMWESRPLFPVLAPWDSHEGKKKKKKYRIQNSMVHCASCLIYSSNQTDRIRRKKESLNYMQK